MKEIPRIHRVRPYYPTFIVDINSDGDNVIRDIVPPDNLPDYDSLRLKSLIDAGIDPRTFSAPDIFGCNLNSYDSICDSNFDDVLPNND